MSHAHVTYTTWIPKSGKMVSYRNMALVTSHGVLDLGDHLISWWPVTCRHTTFTWFNLDSSWAWWRHQMATFSALLAFCVGNSPVTCEFPAQRPVTQSFDVFFDLCLNKRLSKQTWACWFEMPSHSLWRHCNEADTQIHISAQIPWGCSCYKEQIYGKFYSQNGYNLGQWVKAAIIHPFQNPSPYMCGRAVNLWD